MRATFYFEAETHTKNRSFRFQFDDKKSLCVLIISFNIKSLRAVYFNGAI